MERRTTFRPLRQGMAHIPAMAALSHAIRRGREVMPRVTAALPAEAGENVLDCLFFKDRLVLVVSSSSWAYGLRLRQRAIAQAASPASSTPVRLVFRVSPAVGPLPVPARPLPVPDSKVISSMRAAADGLRHEGLRVALRGLADTMSRQSADAAGTSGWREAPG